MNSTTLRLHSLLLAAALAFGVAAPASAVNGVAVDADAVEVAPGLTLREALDTPLDDLDAAAGRELTRGETRAVKRLRRKARATAVAASAQNLSIAALCTGVGGLLFAGVPLLGLAACIVGIVLGRKALKRIKAGEEGSRGMALAGLICGIVGAAIGVIYVAALVAGFAFLAANG